MIYVRGAVTSLKTVEVTLRPTGLFDFGAQSPRRGTTRRLHDTRYVQKSTCTLNRMNRGNRTAVGVNHFAPFVAGS